jgi:hypothetical protein
MNSEVPAHYENPDSFTLYPTQFFDIDGDVDFTPRPATPRPPDRPRYVPTEDEAAGKWPVDSEEETDPEEPPPEKSDESQRR